MGKTTITACVTLPFKFAVGKTATKFFQLLRDEKQIYGLKCDNCGLVAVPPHSTCRKCGETEGGWTPVSNSGKLVNWTGDWKSGEPLTAIVKLDGADTQFVHKLDKYSEDDLKAGLTVEAVWAKERTGSILDIMYFKLS